MLDNLTPVSYTNGMHRVFLLLSLLVPLTSVAERRMSVGGQLALGFQHGYRSNSYSHALITFKSELDPFGIVSAEAFLG